MTIGELATEAFAPPTGANPSGGSARDEHGDQDSASGEWRCREEGAEQCFAREGPDDTGSVA